MKKAMIIQCKIVRKGMEKPPLWKRVILPAHVTFSQMALLLEEVLEMPWSSQYEFEFYKSKIRYIEWENTEEPVRDLYYSIAAAQDYYVLHAITEERRFTFRLRDRAYDLPEYRVEIENVWVRDADGKGENLQYPLCLKEKRLAKDPYWTKGEALDGELRRDFVLHEVNKPTKTKYRDVVSAVKQGKGIACYATEDSREGRFLPSHELVYSLAGSAMGVPGAGSEDPYVKRIVPLECTMRNVLGEYSMSDLRDLAEVTHFTFTRKSKEAMARELSDYLLDPSVMRRLLLTLSPEEMNALGQAAQKGRFRPNPTMDRLLDGARDLGYVTDYTDGSVQMPKEAVFLYEGIMAAGYGAYHEKMYWLLACDYICGLCYGSAPEKVFLKLVCSRSDIAADLDTVKRDFESIPEDMRNCRWMDRRVMHASLVEKRQYIQYERNQKGDGYHEFSEKDIRAIFNEKYPAEQSEYQAFHSFLMRDLRAEKEQADALCRYASELFAMGGMPSELARAIENVGLTFPSEKSVERYAKIMMDMANHTRRAILRGHLPSEVRRRKL